MSDQDSNIFGGEKPSEPVTTNKAEDQTATTQTKVEDKIDINAVFKDHLSSIVDDSGEPKYGDVFTALEALKHSQEYIKTLKEENKVFRENETKADTMEEALRKLSANKAPENDSTKSPDLDAETVRGMTLETLRQYEADKSARANEQAVSDALVKRYGDADKAKEAYNKKAEELGVAPDTLRLLAQQSPKAVLSYFDTKGQESFDKNLVGSVNTDALKAPTTPTTLPKNIMYGASSSDVVSAWKAAGQSVLNELGN